MDNIVIGIEGYVGAGKTSICRKLLDIIPNSVLVNGGNIYRAIIYSIIASGTTLEELKKIADEINIKEIMEKNDVNIDFEDKETILKIGDKKILEEDLQSIEISMAVSVISGSAKNKDLFLYARSLIDNLKKEYNVIVAGRALMIIYPDLDYHFMITADLEERVRRKCIQYGIEYDKDNDKVNEIRENVSTRDKLQEESGYYKLYPNTLVIDITDTKDVEESTEKVLEYIKY